MDYLFPLFAALCALSAWNVHHPVTRQKHGAALSFVNGWLVGELALHVILAEVLVYAWLFSENLTRGWPGVLGTLVCLASWIALGFYYYKARDTADILEEALQSGLGSDYTDQILPRFVQEGPVTLSRRRLLLPHTGLRSRRVEVLRNIVYREASGMRLKLDIRRLRALPGDPPTKPAPVLMQIHGGAWTYRLGSKNEQGLPLMNHLAELGWICVSIDYRLSPVATFPDHIVDCKAALVWIKTHIAEYGGDPDFIVVTGGSAGGHLSALMAVSENRPEFQPGFETADTHVQGCVSFYGIYDFLNENQFHTHTGLSDLLSKSVLKVRAADDPELYRLASPAWHIHEEVAPMMLIQGDRDSLVAPAESSWFADRLRRTSREPVVYVELPGAQHAFDMFPSLRSELCLQGIDRFLGWLYSRYLTTQALAEQPNWTPSEQPACTHAQHG